jgi:hypothetical protein
VITPRLRNCSSWVCAAGGRRGPHWRSEGLQDQLIDGMDVQTSGVRCWVALKLSCGGGG